MYPNKKFVQAANRAIRISLSIVVITLCNSASADNFFTRLLPTAFMATPAAKPSPAPAKQAPRQAAKPAVVKGELIYVVCSDDGGARVRGNDMKSVIFNATQFETLKPFQGWGQNKQIVNVGNEKLSFVRVQFDSKENRSTNVGWLAQKFIKLKSQCPGATQAASLEGTNATVTSLAAGNCCRFPITHHPLMSYTTGERQFGALRGGGRIHAAADLYGKFNEPILAVAPGKVIRGLYEFYNSTYAIDVKHQGGFVVRYGEISGKRAKTSNTGTLIKMGEKIAHMGQLVPRVREPMLHFELYRGDMNGALNVPKNRKNGYGRRKDLINPTKHLQRWEQSAF
jgi:murein DD-endopeptidase MepM/ murein hydrolase activator NlpD